MEASRERGGAAADASPAPIIAQFVREQRWVDGDVGPGDVTFLAAGEYNANYVVDAADGRYVFRINHGGQLGLSDQITYEYRVLSALAESGVTPRPYRVAQAGKDELPPEFGDGVLLMEFLPGRPLDYRSDLALAARIFARVHAMEPGDGFVVQARPVRDIAEESLGLITRYHDVHPLKKVGERLLRFHEEIMRLDQEMGAMFDSEDLVMVNTEVNSGNFIVDGARAWLVDWEKAVLSHRYQDLGHFLVATTTLWKTDFEFTQGQKEEFVRAYLAEAGVDLPWGEAVYKTQVLERTILLRALSWCYMAFCEYTRQDRAIKNEDTFRVIKTYLANHECFLA